MSEPPPGYPSSPYGEGDGARGPHGTDGASDHGDPSNRGDATGWLRLGAGLLAVVLLYPLLIAFFFTLSLLAGEDCFASADRACEFDPPVGSGVFAAWVVANLGVVWALTVYALAGTLSTARLIRIAAAAGAALLLYELTALIA